MSRSGSSWGGRRERFELARRADEHVHHCPAAFAAGREMVEICDLGDIKDFQCSPLIRLHTCEMLK